MDEAVDASGFSDAMEFVRQRKPLGFKYLLSHENELSSAYYAGFEEGQSSPYFVSAEQFQAEAVYTALAVVARTSYRLRRFRRPCCSRWPITWPICNRAC